MDLRETPTGADFRRHPWETARAAFFRDVLAGHALPGGCQRLLDVGAGDGWFARQLLPTLRPGAQVVCWDEGYSAAVPAQEPGTGLSFSAERPAGTFDLALLLDVLEHVEDDAGFLRTLVRDSLGEGAHVLFSVPAWPALMSSHDVALRHHRRYTPAGARAVLEAAGLRVLRSGGLFHGLLLPRALACGLERLRGSPAPQGPPASLRWGGPAWLATAVEAALRLDNAVSRSAADRGLSLPGLTWWALCQK